MILQSLIRLYDRDGTMPALGYEVHPFQWAIVLDEAGNVADLEDIRIDGKAIPLNVPAWAANRTSAILPSFLSDTSQYVLGIDERRGASWRERNLEVLAGATDPMLVAVRQWLEAWTAEAGTALAKRHGVAWGEVVAIKIGDDFAHERPEARALWDAQRSEAASERGLCLLTGETGPLVETHGSVTLGSDGAKLISVDGDSTALRHWGWEGNDNAPISERAAHAYVTALRKLRERGQIAYVAGLAVAYWSEAESVAGRAFEAELLAAMTGTVVPTAEAETRGLSDAMASLRRGQLPKGASPEAPYHVLAIEPGQGRHAVRWSHHSTLGDYCEHVRQHLEDTGLENVPPIPALLGSARPGGAKTPRPIALAMVRAVLTGSAYPTSLASGVLGRLRVGEALTWERAAILRGWLARNCNIERDEMTDTPAYRMGQVLRVVERMQLAVNPGVTATVRARLWGLLTTRPAAGLDRLMDQVAFCKPSLRRGGKLAQAEWFDNRIAELLAGVELPAAMSEQDRAQMALGYYAERGRGEPVKDNASATHNNAN